MSNLTTTDVTEKRISLVYNSDITGFQPMDFSKIDGIESLLTSGISVTANLAQGINSSSLTSVDQTKAIAVQIFNEDGSIIGGSNEFLKAYPAGLGSALAEYVNNEGINYPLPVTIIQQKKSNISNFTVSGTNGTVLQPNANREELFVQNLQSGNLYVKYGASANSNSFNFILTSGSASGAGDGGSLSDLNYTGILSVSGVSPNYICWERS